jgi:hypothetical protein
VGDPTGVAPLAQEVIMRIRAQTLPLSLLLTVACAAAAGTVEVSFVNPASYIDAGGPQWDKDANLQLLQRHLQSLGPRLLPANQVLKVELLDVDLAGDLQPARIRGEDVRVLKGKTDYPRIRLKYALEADGMAQGSGTEWVIDLDYAHGLPSWREAEPLYYEKRMLETWFKARFVDARGGG